MSATHSNRYIRHTLGLGIRSFRGRLTPERDTIFINTGAGAIGYRSNGPPNNLNMSFNRFVVSV
jgi:hypothetical protein